MKTPIHKSVKLFYLLLAIGAIFSVVWVALLYLSVRASSDSTKPLAGKEKYTPEDVTKLEKTIERYKSDLEIVNAHFIDRTSSVNLIEQIEAASRQTGVALKINQASDSDKVEVTFTATGDFVSLVQFASLLENMPFKLDFSRLDLSYKDEGGVAKPNIARKWTMAATIGLLSLKN